METINYIHEHGFEKLATDFGIIVKRYPEENLAVLNYSQVNSPKDHPIVKECRGLIITIPSFSDKFKPTVVSRSFDRFFNLGEQGVTADTLDFSNLRCHEKVDGSLIKIYYWSGWRVATRGTAFAETSCNGSSTFRELVIKALGIESDEEFQQKCGEYLHPDWTYIFELTCAENRVVKRYEGCTLHYLASRYNCTGEYDDAYEEKQCLALGAQQIKKYSFDSVEDCVAASKELEDLDEGYVLYNQEGKPVVKIKSPKYVAVHHIRGEGLSPKRIYELIALREEDEYLSYFPEDTDWVQSVNGKLLHQLAAENYEYFLCKAERDQKKFAYLVKDRPLSSLHFKARQKKSWPSIVFWYDIDTNQKVRLMKKLFEG